MRTLEKTAFSLYDLFGHVLAQEPLPHAGGNSQMITDSSLIIITIIYIFNLSDLCLGIKKIFKEIMHFHYMTFSLDDLYGHLPAQELRPRGREIYNYGKPFLSHHYHVPSLFDPCPREEKIRIFNQIMHFHYITYMARP